MPTTSCSPKISSCTTIADSAPVRYCKERREALGGYLPAREIRAEPLVAPELSAFSALLEGSGERELSTTMVFVRLLMTLSRDTGCRVEAELASNSVEASLEQGLVLHGDVDAHARTLEDRPGKTYVSRFYVLRR